MKRVIALLLCLASFSAMAEQFTLACHLCLRPA